MYNKWAPKRQHFSYARMITRSQLAVMDFNEGSKIEQATGQGDKRYNINISKITKNWCSKLIKGKKDQIYLHKMLKETIESAANDQRLENPILPSLPRNIASVPKPEKSTVIQNQLSRFGN